MCFSERNGPATSAPCHWAKPRGRAILRRAFGSLFSTSEDASQGLQRESATLARLAILHHQRLLMETVHSTRRRRRLDGITSTRRRRNSGGLPSAKRCCSPGSGTSFKAIESDVMNLVEAAAFLRCHPKTLQRQAVPRNIPHKRLGASWRFYRPKLEAWMEEDK